MAQARRHGKAFRRCWLPALLALSMVSPTAAQAAKDAATPTAQVWVAERALKGAKGYTLRATFSWGAEGGLAAVAVFRRQSSGLRPVSGALWDQSGLSGPRASANGVVYGCTSSSPCGLKTEGGISDFAATAPDTEPPVDVVLLVVKGYDQRVTLHSSPGWRLRRTTLKPVFVTSEGMGNAAASFWSERVEHFSSSSGRGGPTGSIAIATPPCRPAHQVGYAREGIGSARLLGGQFTARVDCSAGSSDAVDIAARATRWQLTGDVSGVAMGSTRLVIVGLSAAHSF